ncbi:NAD(P)H-hydrate epimerase [Shigella flexneri]
MATWSRDWPTRIGVEVTLSQQESDEPLPGGAALAREAWLNAGGDQFFEYCLAESVNLIVDALLGTGLRQAPRESISQLIDHAKFPSCADCGG